MAGKTDYKTASKVLGVLRSESALKIVALLGRRRKLCVSEIAREIGLSVSATSHQLSKLESAGLLYSTRSGRTICYFPRRKRVIDELVGCIKRLVVLSGRTRYS